MKVSSSMMHVCDLHRSVKFYRDVFSCAADSALLFTPNGFPIYMQYEPDGRREGVFGQAPGVNGACAGRFVVGATDD